mgnify:CR=1 FL=1
MDKKDMTLLIEAEDAINDMDRLLVQLTSMGHSDGLFNKIDNCLLYTSPSPRDA